MSTREAVLWCGILTGIFALMWMAHVLMATEREIELMLVLVLGGGGLSLLSRQAGRIGIKLVMYTGFAAAGICFATVVLTGLNMLVG